MHSKHLKDGKKSFSREPSKERKKQRLLLKKIAADLFGETDKNLCYAIFYGHIGALLEAKGDTTSFHPAQKFIVE